MKKTAATRFSARPLRSSAATVLSKLGSAGSPAIASISRRCSASAASKAGRKCPTAIRSQGGLPNGVSQSASSGLAEVCVSELIMAPL